MRPIRPDGTVSVEGYLPILKSKACIPCRSRKVKCDRSSPCGNCSSWSVDCIFPSPKRTCRRRPKTSVPQPQSAVRVNTRNAPSVEERLQAVERLLRRLVAPGNGDGPIDQSTIWEGGETAGNAIPPSGIQMGPGGIQATLNSIVAFVEGDSGPPILNRNESSHWSTPFYPVRPTSFPFDTFNLDAASLHPPTSLMRTCWRTYLHNIDPLIKVLHRQSTETVFQKAAREPISLSTAESALLFAVYFASLSSMPPDIAEQSFGFPKLKGLRTYRGAMEHALMRANLFTTEELLTLQGFVLFLSVDRFGDNARRVWALSGLASRLGSTGSTQMSVFEKEMRKRLRWKLWYLDHRAHEDLGHGLTPPDETELPELPTNVKDGDLQPDMEFPPKPYAGWAEISFSLMQFEIAVASRGTRFSFQSHNQTDVIDACGIHIHSTYLRYCDGTEPIHWLAQHVSHVLIMELRFRLHCQQQVWRSTRSSGLSHPSQEELFYSAIDILDTDRRIRLEPGAAKWSWLLNAYMQFWPLRFALGQLCLQPDSTYFVDHAWQIVEKSYGKWEENEAVATGADAEKAKCLSLLLSQAQAGRNTLGTDSKDPWLGPNHFISGNSSTPSIFLPRSGDYQASERMPAYPQFPGTSVADDEFAEGGVHDRAQDLCYRDIFGAIPADSMGFDNFVTPTFDSSSHR